MKNLSCETHRIETFALGRDATNTPDSHPKSRLFLANPRVPGPVAVLYMLDGNAAFRALTTSLLTAHPRLAVVGVGYDTDQSFAREARIFDYSPPPVRPDPHHPGRRAGGGAAHLARLLGPVRAAAEARIHADPARRSLWGHSFGGLFVIYTLAMRPDAFARYAAISPSVWWDEPLMRRLVQRARPNGQSLFFGVGDAEKHRGAEIVNASGPPPTTLALGEQLAQLDGLHLMRTVFNGAQHIETILTSLSQTFDIASK